MTIYKTTAVGRSEVFYSAVPNTEEWQTNESWGESPLTPFIREQLRKTTEDMFSAVRIPAHIFEHSKHPTPSELIAGEVQRLHNEMLRGLLVRGEFWLDEPEPDGRQMVELYGLPVLMNKQLPPGSWYIKAREE